MGFSFGYADAPIAWQIGFQDPATPVMQGLIDLHHDVCFFLVVILVFVLWMGTRTLTYFHAKKNPMPEKIIHGTQIEIAWTVLPSLVLICIAIPSFALLYSLDEVVDPAVTVKSIGHQWYWSYEYSDAFDSGQDAQTLLFDSYMVPEDDLMEGGYRLLEVDNRVVLPVNTHIRMIITAADVIHSWAVPSLGVKCDAIPGRLNGVPIFIKREGVYYGQCSELCGANHAFMPIVVEAVGLQEYVTWITNKIQSQYFWGIPFFNLLKRKISTSPSALKGDENWKDGWVGPPPIADCDCDADFSDEIDDWAQSPTLSELSEEIDRIKKELETLRKQIASMQEEIASMKK